MPSALLWAFSAEIVFLICCSETPAGVSEQLFFTGRGGVKAYGSCDTPNIYHHGICNPAAGWFVYKADRHPAAAGTERNERSKPSMFQGLGPLLGLLGGGSLTKLHLFLLKGLFG